MSTPSLGALQKTLGTCICARGADGRVHRHPGIGEEFAGKIALRKFIDEPAKKPKTGAKAAVFSFEAPTVVLGLVGDSNGFYSVQYEVVNGKNSRLLVVPEGGGSQS